jgi:lipopolysaccharide/colanic/teichoic acid biosynthesis glycosyltransferase
MIAEATLEPVGLAPVPRPDKPTIWGLDPDQLHDHFWAARGVFVVRLGEPREIPRDAELYLLTDARTLTIFRLAPLMDTLNWVRPSVLFVRLVARQEESSYRETVVTDDDDRFLRFRRVYGNVLPRLARVALTRDAKVAHAWQRSVDSRAAWRRLRRESRSKGREAATITGRAYDRSSSHEVARFVSDLTRFWKQPCATVSAIRAVSRDVWSHESGELDPSVRCVGSVWIGAGRKLEPGATVLGPAVLWDAPECRPEAPGVRWSELEPAKVLALVRRRQAVKAAHTPRGKRLFDILFACFVLLLTLPLYPLVMLAILLEDGRPFFFAHKRETRGGREFGCIKFRSMRKDAEKVKAELQKTNQADGPQFYMAHDPRLTRVGRFIRKTNMDELPQFVNVLLGHMSVVGPRPSPHAENQFSPAWREARLSVRAGVTGLWQVARTRQPGLDFQEWIRYDLEYVQNGTWRLDLSIILRTVRVLLVG